MGLGGVSMSDLQGPMEKVAQPPKTPKDVLCLLFIPNYRAVNIPNYPRLLCKQREAFPILRAPMLEIQSW